MTRRTDASDSEEDDDDDVDDARATLCVAGRLSSARERDERACARDAHKVGGAPVTFATRARDAGGGGDGGDGGGVERAIEALCRVACASCGRGMTLVFQTHAPSGTRDARALYGYACARGCRGNGAWACVRACAREDAMREGAFERAFEHPFGRGAVSSTTARRDGARAGVVELAPAMEDSWDDPESSAWCDDGGGLDALNAELEAMLSLAPARVRSAGESTGGDEATSGTAVARARGSLARAMREAYDAACDKQFVEYYLIADAEPAGAGALSAAETAHAESLLAAYAEREGVSVSDVIADDAEWEGETYERGEATHADDAYLRFNRRLARAPEQCMRYRAGGLKVLWPTRTPPKPTSCEMCGAERVCEIQLTPALLTDVEDALAMYKGDRKLLANEDDLLAWDWQTVCVFTCPNSCVPEGEDDVSYVREHVVVAESEVSGDALLKATRVT